MFNLRVPTYSEFILERIEFLDKYPEKSREIYEFVEETIQNCKTGAIDFDGIPESYKINSENSINVSSVASRFFEIQGEKIMISFIKAKQGKAGCVLFRDEIKFGYITILIKMSYDADFVFGVIQHEISHIFTDFRYKERGIKDPYANYFRNDGKIGPKSDIAGQSNNTEEEDEYSPEAEDIKYYKQIVNYLFYKLFNETERFAFISGGSVSYRAMSIEKKCLDDCERFLDKLDLLLLWDWDWSVQDKVRKTIIDYIVQKFSHLKWNPRRNGSNIQHLRDKSDYKKVKFFIEKGRSIIDNMRYKIDKNYAIYNDEKIPRKIKT